VIVQIIQYAIYVAVFCFVAWGCSWICAKFALPQWVLWICGAILLIVLLLFVAGQFSVGSGGNFRVFPHGQ
jgi:phosphate starvation-inducible membrane PsiE